MSSTDRQNRLLVAEDWKRIYQTYRNADFKSYDFDNLRRTMIAYLRENYPEDFNDYIESSEYLALIDLIAFLGQNLAFRIDLNSRENYLELAERRESVLRLARLLSYNPKRNQSANGLLKIESVSTTEDITDSNNFNLANQKRENVSLENFAGKRKILNIFPSIDTPTCALSVKRFNDEAAKLNNTVVLCISADLPFAQKRFCGAEGVENIETLSAFRDIAGFANAFGVAINDSSLQGLTSRAVIVVDENNPVMHSEFVSEITEEPDYDSALNSLA